jgi:hypothetical protein
VYGPVRTVVWEGRSRKAPPYPDCAENVGASGVRASYWLLWGGEGTAKRKFGMNTVRAGDLRRDTFE